MPNPSFTRQAFIVGMQLPFHGGNFSFSGTTKTPTIRVSISSRDFSV